MRCPEGHTRKGGEGATPRGVRRRKRLNLLIEPQFGRNRGVVAGTRAMISSRLDRPVAVRRENLVETSVAAELAGAHVDSGDASVVEIRLERPFGGPVAREGVAVARHDGRRAAGAELVALVDQLSSDTRMGIAIRRGAPVYESIRRRRAGVASMAWRP